MNVRALLFAACGALPLACTSDAGSPADSPATTTAGGGGAAAQGGLPAGGNAQSLSGGTAGASMGGSAGTAASTAGSSAQSTAGAPSGGGEAQGGAGGAAPLQDVTVWIAGDSTVATSGGTPCPKGWGGQFAPLFTDQVTVVNSAVGGRSVRTWLYDVTDTMDDQTGECEMTLDSDGQPVLQQRWQDMLIGMKSGDFLFIQFGINDSSATCPRHVGLEAFKESYGMMAQAAKDRGAQPVFVTPVSAIKCDGTNTAVGTRGSFVTATQEAGQEYGVPVIDLHALSVELYNTLGFCPVPGGDVSASTTGPVGDFFCIDHTHFEEAGAAQIAALVAGALEPAGLALAAYLQ